MKLHHIGVAVENLESAISRYVALGLPLAHREDVPSQRVKVAFLGGGPYVELLEGTDPESPVSRFLRKRGPGQHHVAFAVPDILAELKRRAAQGARLIDSAPRLGAWGHQVAFLHPESNGGVLIELVQENQSHG